MFSISPYAETITALSKGRVSLIHGRVLLDLLQGFHPVAGEMEIIASFRYFLAKAHADHTFKIGLVIDYKDAYRHGVLELLREFGINEVMINWQ
jgi:hypothetical protein